MNVRDIPRAQWPAFLDQFSRTHRAWLATIDADGTADGQNGTPHPLRSVTPFVYNDCVVHIDIRFQDDEPGHEPVRITRPVSIRVEETTEGIAQGLEFTDDKGGPTRLRFRAAAAHA